LKHKFIITYETDGLPICPDAIHEQLDLAMVNIRKNFAKQYAKLPGLHKLSLEPCGSWFPEEQMPMRFRAQARKRSSVRLQGPGFPDSCNNLFDREIE
jgi:hypothetical protein